MHLQHDPRAGLLDSTEAFTDATPPRPRRWPAPLAAAIVGVAYAAVLAWLFQPAITEPDANGYWAQASLLVETGRTWFTPAVDSQYIGMHWLLTPDGTYISRYPPGLAVVIGAVYAVFGHEAAVLVNPILAVLALAGFFLLGRRLIGGWWSVAGMAILAVNPTFTRHALVNDSHMAVACVLVWGWVFLLRWAQTHTLRDIFIAGLIFGIIPTIRYPDAVMGLAVIAFIAAQWRTLAAGRRPLWMHALVGFAGAMVMILPLLIRNQLVLGAFWKTGYALTNEQTGFGWDYFTAHYLSYLQTLSGEGLGLMFALGLVGIVVMCCARGSRAIGWACVLMVVPMLLVYMAYYWAPRSMAAGTLRFLVPILPVLVLAGMWLLAQVTRPLSRTGTIAVPGVVVALQVVWAGTLPAELQRMQFPKQALSVVTRELEQTAKAGDVVVASNAILQHLDFVRAWPLIDAGFAQSRAVLRGPAGRDPDDPSPMQWERQEQRRALLNLTPQQRRERFIADVRALAHGRAVYVVGSEREVEQTLGNEDFIIVKRIAIPEMPESLRETAGNTIRGAPGGAPPDRQGRSFRPGRGMGFGMDGLMGVREIVVAEWFVGG